jgi:spore coat protein U-like protein
MKRRNEMKRMMILLVMALVMFTSNAFAATTTLDVTAYVAGTCTFDTAATALTFGELDTVSAPAVNTTGSVEVACSNGTPFTVTNNSTGVLTGGALGGTIDYVFSFLGGTDTGVGLGAGNTINVSYQADIAGGNNYDTAVADLYSETVTLTINP